MEVFRQPSNDRRTLGTLRVLLIVVLFVMAAMNLVALWKVRPLIVTGHSDFVSYYSAGRMLRSGQGDKLFDEAAQFDTQQQFSAFVRARQQPFPYIHPPFEALLFVPLSYLSYLPAYEVWIATNLILLAVILYRLRHDLPFWQQLPRSLCMVLPLAFFPCISLFAQGQDDILFLGLLVLCFLALRRQAPLTAGFWLGLASFRPQFALPLLAIVVAGGAWYVASGFVVTCIGLVLLSAGIFGWREVGGYPRHLFYSEQSSNPHGVLLRAMPNLHGLISGLLPNGIANATLVVSSVAVLTLAIWAWRKSRRSDLELAFALAIVTTLLVSYHAFPHDLTLLIFALLLQVSSISHHAERDVGLWLPVLPAFLVLTPPICYLAVRFNCFNLVAVGLLIWLTGGVLVRAVAPPPS